MIEEEILQKAKGPAIAIVVEMPVWDRKFFVDLENHRHWNKSAVGRKREGITFIRCIEQLRIMPNRHINHFPLNWSERRMLF